MGVTAYLKEMMNSLAVIDSYFQLMSFKHIKKYIYTLDSLYDVLIGIQYEIFLCISNNKNLKCYLPCIT